MKDYNAASSPEKNVGKGEQIISLAIGSYLLYKSLVGKKSIPMALAAGFLLFRGSKGYCPLYKALGIDNTKTPPGILVKTSLTVNKTREEVYSFWRRLENLPRFMKHLEAVSVLDESRSQWKAKIPGGLGTIDWQSEIISDIPNESIVWQSLPGSQIENMGAVTFVDAGKFGTEVHVEISYRAPAGNLGAGVGKLFTPVVEGMIREDIKNFRRIIETGELPTIEGQASGTNK